MPRHGSHIILPWMTEVEKAYPEEQHPPTVPVPHFDFLDIYDCFFTNFTSSSSMNMRTLWADGYLAYSLTPQGMEDYLCDRLRIQTRGGQRPDVWIYGSMFLVNSRTLRDSPPCPPYMQDSRGNPWWLIDYVFEPGTSSIVRQRLNTLHSPMPLRAKLNLPVFFRNRNGKLGVSVSAAAASVTPGIQGEEMVFEAIRTVSSTHIVVDFHGYLEFSKQTETRVAGQPHTVGRFVYHVGLVMKKFLANAPSLLANRPTPDVWRVDDAWANTLYIVGIVQVSAGRWQPILSVGN